MLKLLYRSGKTKLNNEDLLFIEYVERIKCRSTTIKYIRLLLELNFLSYNEKTGYFLLNSFEKIRQFHDWKIRLAFPIDYSNYNKTQAVTGAVIYGYLHKNFWRNVKRKKSVHIKGSTYNFQSSTFNYKKQFAPVSVIGVAKIFGISEATAVRLKKASEKAGFIKIKKNFSEEIKDKSALELFMKYTEIRSNLVYYQKKYRLQLIDTVYPLFCFIKRNSLKT